MSSRRRLVDLIGATFFLGVNLTVTATVVYLGLDAAGRWMALGLTVAGSLSAGVVAWWSYRQYTEWVDTLDVLASREVFAGDDEENR